jgi:phenylacetate-coenzyme A ligase PaaK-like adenylate-forming protein
MPLLRYRLNDLIKVISLSDDESGINLPHIAFQRRISDVINIGGMANLDEKVIWQAIADTGIKYTEWTACKEYDQNQTYIRLYLELKEEREASEIETMIDEKLRIIDVDYKDVQSILNLQPVRVTLLSPGTFQAFTDEKTKEGADLAHLKPAHVNPPEELVQRLLEFSEINSKD